MLAPNTTPAGAQRKGQGVMETIKPFDPFVSSVPIRSFGVDYFHTHFPESGDLYLARFGWPFARQLHPDQWFTDGHYKHAGRRLPGPVAS